MPAVRTPEASRPTRHIAVPRCSLPRREIGSATSITFDFAALPCGAGLSIRSLAFRPATSLSTLRSGCYQTPRKTRYAAAWLWLCRGRHPRRLNSTRLQGATLAELCMRLSPHTAPIRQTRRSSLSGLSVAFIASSCFQLSREGNEPPRVCRRLVGLSHAARAACLSWA